MNNFSSFHIMAKPIGPICNLGCSYCFYLEKEIIYQNENKWAMPDNVLENYIKEYIEAQSVNEITFAWQGGEPTLLGLEYFKKIVKYQKQYANDKIIHNAFQTNGVLLNDNWCRFFVENNFLVGLSIDGPEELNNKYRVTKSGKPSFNKLMKGLRYLKKHSVQFNTLTCVQRNNSYKPLEVYNFLKEIGSSYIQFIPIVERTADETNKDDLQLISPDYNKGANVTEWSVEPLQYANFLNAIFDEWVKHDVGKIFVQTFDIALEAWLGYDPSLCIFSQECGDAMALEHNGDLYSCDHYVYPENKLGNIMEESMQNLVNSEKQIKFGNDKKDTLPQYCKDCNYLFACNGDCPKHRFIKTPSGEAGLSYLCAGYKHFFSHIDPLMKFMANELQNERPPANVMRIANMK